MRNRRITTGAAIAMSAVAIVGLGAPAIVRAADHLDAPALNGALQSPGGRHDADIADTYVFRSPQHGGRTVFAVTTHPFLGAITTDPTYGTDIRYNIHLDPVGKTHGDDEEALTRQTLQVTFGPAGKDGSQRFTVALIRGSRHRVLAHGRTNRLNGNDGENQGDNQGDNVRAFAGKVSDPFFFDLGAFNNTVQNRLTMHILPLNTNGKPAVCTSNQGVDTFATANANAIVLEVPNELVGRKVNVWASTVRTDGTQIDRMARPAINTVFNGKKALLNEGDDQDKNLFNGILNPSLDPTTTTSPDTGPTFHDNVVTVLKAFDSVAKAVGNFPPRSDATINGLANLLLPDVLPYDPAVAKTDGVTNGRSLTDDVIDTELPIVTNGLVSTDCVGPHTDYRSRFPYLGAPH